MGDSLPGIDNPGHRTQITEDDLAPASGITSPASPPVFRSPAALPIAANAKTSLTPAARPGVPASDSYCSGCGSAIHPQAVVCPRCGVATVSAQQATSAAMNVAMNSKSTGLAILLSLVFTGAGHWYVGRVGRGLAFFAAAFVSGLLIFALVGLFVLPIVWVWAAIDANKCAHAHNQLLLAQAGAPIPPIALNS